MTRRILMVYYLLGYDLARILRLIQDANFTEYDHRILCVGICG